MAFPSLDWSAIDHVLLDMDGTILDLAYDTHFWQHLLPRRYAAHHGLSLEHAEDRLRPQFEATQGTLNWYCLDHWSAVTGLDIIAMKTEPETRARIAPLPGSLRFLEQVHASGRALWLATNAHHGSWRPKLEATGIGAYFEKILSSHDFGAPKEDARFWSALQARHPFDPSRTLFADDSLPVLRAARAYGIAQVVAIGYPDSSRPRRQIDEFPCVDRLEDLLPVG